MRIKTRWGMGTRNVDAGAAGASPARQLWRWLFRRWAPERSKPPINAKRPLYSPYRMAADKLPGTPPPVEPPPPVESPPPPVEPSAPPDPPASTAKPVNAFGSVLLVLGGALFFGFKLVSSSSTINPPSKPQDGTGSASPRMTASAEQNQLAPTRKKAHFALWHLPASSSSADAQPLEWIAASAPSADPTTEEPTKRPELVRLPPVTDAPLTRVALSALPPSTPHIRPPFLNVGANWEDNRWGLNRPNAFEFRGPKASPRGAVGHSIEGAPLRATVTTQ
jgi:hypothetical protein